MAAPYPYTANVTFATPGSYLFPSPTDWGAVTVQPEAPAAFALKGQRESSYMDSYLEVQWGRPEDGYAVCFVFHNSLLTDRHSVEIFRTWAA